MELLERLQRLLTSTIKYFNKTKDKKKCFKFSRTHRHPISPPKTASSTATPYFPITVLYEEKSGKTTPYELVLKSNTSIGEVCFFFDF
jgi:hypothetical protein